MALKIRTTGAADYQRYIKMLVCGSPGAGKTRSSSTWKNPLYASAEGGMMSVADRNLPVVDITRTSDLSELIVSLDQDPKVREKLIGAPVDTVVVDTIDEIARIFVVERIEAEKIESMRIQDWGWMGDQLRGLIRAMRNLPVHVVFCCHLRSTEDSESGRTFFKPAIQGALGDEIPAYFDLAVLLTARPVMKVVEGKNVRQVVRTMQTYPDSHHPWIKDRSGKLPMEFPVNFNDDFSRLHGLIYGESEVQADEPQAPVVEPVKPVEPPKVQVTNIVQPKPQVQVEQAIIAPKKQEEEIVILPEVRKPAPELVVPAVEIISESETVNNGVEPETRLEWQTCKDCGGYIENRDVADLSFVRFKKHLCRTCFSSIRKAK